MSDAVGAPGRGDMTGRSVLVTGAGGGIGHGIASLLVERGAAVTAVDVKERPPDLEACRYVVADITEPDAPQRLVAEASRGRGLDCLVNAAGVGWFDRDSCVAEMNDRVWDQVLAINLTAPMRLSRAAIPRLPRGGALVHIASIVGLRSADEPLTAYQVSKAGLINLSRALALQLAEQGIRSNTICPGAIETPMLAGIYEGDPTRRERMANRTPIKRLGTPGDVAEACLYLLSDAASFVTGTDLVVDGGWFSILP